MRGKILILIPELSCTGAPESVANMAEVIQKMGFYVTVGTLGDGQKSEQIEKLGISVKSINNEMLNRNQCAVTVAGFDMCIVNTSMLTWCAVNIQEIIPTILIIREAKSILEFQDIFGTSIKELYKVHRVFCVSKYAQVEIFNETGIKPRILHNFVPDKFVQNRNHNKKNNINFGIIGTIEERKGIDLCIKAFVNLQKEYKNCRLFIVGRTLDWQKDYWMPLMKIIDSNENIIYQGEIIERNSMVDMYENLDVIVVASRDESCSLVALEAAMMGKALIVSENVGAKYLINGINGCVFETGNERSLLMAMKKMVKIPEILFLRGKISRILYKRRASEKRYWRELEKIIEECI